MAKVSFRKYVHSDKEVRIKGWRTATVETKVYKERRSVTPLMFNRW